MGERMATIADQLRNALLDFDGRATTILGEAEAKLRHAPDYVDALIAMIPSDEAHVSAGATWLLKSAFEAKLELSVEQMQAYCELVPRVTKWAAQLHTCQSIQFFTVPVDAQPALIAWLKPLLQSERPFLRAWSLDALAHIAAGNADDVDMLQRWLAAGLADDAASVRARARQIERRLSP